MESAMTEFLAYLSLHQQLIINTADRLGPVEVIKRLRLMFDFSGRRVMNVPDQFITPVNANPAPLKLVDAANALRLIGVMKPLDQIYSR
jgi:hypothetical protein